jgi:hypothetical protein
MKMKNEPVNNLNNQYNTNRVYFVDFWKRAGPMDRVDMYG